MAIVAITAPAVAAKKITAKPPATLDATNQVDPRAEDERLARALKGQLRDQLEGSRFSVDWFPELADVLRGFASRVGKPEDWRKVPLSLPRDEWPHLLPLRVAFETRNGIDAVFKPIKDDKGRALRICTFALTALLKETGDQLEAIATPTAEMREAQHKVIKVGRR